jgi:hypothetical protein
LVPLLGKSLQVSLDLDTSETPTVSVATARRLRFAFMPLIVAQVDRSDGGGAMAALAAREETRSNCM